METQRPGPGPGLGVRANFSFLSLLSAFLKEGNAESWTEMPLFPVAGGAPMPSPPHGSSCVICGRHRRSRGTHPIETLCLLRYLEL